MRHNRALSSRSLTKQGERSPSTTANGLTCAQAEVVMLRVRSTVCQPRDGGFRSDRSEISFDEPGETQDRTGLETDLEHAVLSSIPTQQLSALLDGLPTDSGSIEPRIVQRVRLA